MKGKKVNNKIKEKDDKIKGIKIGEGFEIYDLALKYKDILIFGDFHLGYEESMNKQGILIPRFQIKDTISRVAKILKSAGEVETIVLTGDVKHEFGKIYDDEWMGVLALIDFMKEHCRRLIITEGNDIRGKLLSPFLKGSLKKFEIWVVADKVRYFGRLKDLA